MNKKVRKASYTILLFFMLAMSLPVVSMAQEYEYNGKRYVRVEANSCYNGNNFTLSNGEEYKDGDNVWEITFKK